jgi:hypothetical protein
LHLGNTIPQLLQHHYSTIHVVVTALHKTVAAVLINDTGRQIVMMAVAVIYTALKMLKLARQFSGAAKQHLYTIFCKGRVVLNTVFTSVQNKIFCHSQVCIANHNTGRPPPAF